MARKNLSISARPQVVSDAADAWTQAKPAAPAVTLHAEKTSRITVDLPKDIHTQLKILAAQEQVPIMHLVRSLIEERLAR